MNRNLLIALAVLILLIIGGGYLFLSSNKQPSSIGEAQDKMMGKSGEVTSLKNLLNSKNNQQCTFSDSEAQTSGTMYISGGKARGDFSSVVDGKTVASSMLSTGQEIYIWMDNSPTGFKTSLDAIEQAQSQMPQSVDINKESSYTCSPWSPVDSYFTPPSSITFTDYSSMFKNAGNASGAPVIDKATMCAGCDNLTDDARTECRTTLQCN